MSDRVEDFDTPTKWDIFLDELKEKLKEDFKDTQAKFQELKDLIKPPDDSLQKFMDEYMEANRKIQKFSSDLLKEIDWQSMSDAESDEINGMGDVLGGVLKNKDSIQDVIDTEIQTGMPDLMGDDVFGEKIDNDIQKIDDLNDSVGRTIDLFNEEWVAETLSGASGMFADGLAECLSDFEHFGDGLKSLGDDLKTYLIKSAVDALMEIVMQSKLAEVAIKGASLPVNSLINAGKTVGGVILSTFGIGKHHSGGAVLPSAGAMLPGTQEQLALLKGGERVLSPSETASYNDDVSSGAGQPVVFLNNNIKAWDSKDVRQYLIENASLLQSITAQGIRDNKHYLRTMIRNA